MGQLLVGLAGGAIGFAFGNPSLGFAIGAFIGGLLFPADPIRIEGPRREDLRVSSSTYGRPIPEGFGVIRLPSNMIWTSGIREVKTTTEVGGKGGLGAPSQEQVTYTYFVDASFAFAHGPADAILRVFADGKVIYDTRDPSTTGATLTATTKPGLTLRTYLGTATQLPCPTITAAEGAANTPAFRNTVYITLESFELTDFGNRIPQITAEVAFKATSSNSGRLSVDKNSPSDGGAGLGIDWRRDRMYALDTDGQAEGIRVYSVSTLQEVRQQGVLDMNLTGRTTIDGISLLTTGRWTGRLYLSGSSNHVRIHIIDPDSLTELGFFGADTAGDFNHQLNPDRVAFLGIMAEAQCFATGAVPAGLIQKTFILGFSQAVTDGPALIDVSIPSAPLWIGFDNNPTVVFPESVIAEPPQAQTAVFWVLHQNPADPNATITLRKWEVDFNAFLDLPNDRIVGLRQFTVTTFPSSIWDNDGGPVQTAWGPIYDETDGNLLFGIGTSTGTTMWKYNPTLDAIQWITKDVPGTINAAHHVQTTRAARVRNGRMGIANGSGSGNYGIVDTISGEIVDSGSNINGDFSAWRGLGAVNWDDTLQVFTSAHRPNITNSYEQYFIGRKTGIGESLSSVVSELSGENVNGAGLKANEFDVTQLVNDTVKGYAVTRQIPSRQAIEPLFSAYDFDAAEIDDKVVFVKRNSTSLISLTEADFVAGEPVFKETRTQEVELAAQLDLGYIDKDLDYQESIARAKRPNAPVPSIFSLKNESLDWAIVMTAVEAKEAAERLLFTAWSQRQQIAFTLGTKYLRLVPTDVITLTMDSGTVFLLRVVVADTSGGHTIAVEAVVQDSTLQLSSNAVADTSLGFEEDDLPVSVNTRLCLIDAPYLRDIDATNRLSLELKYAMAGFSSGWQAGTLWDSADGLTFNPVARSTLPKTYGIVTNKLPTGFQNLTDVATTLNVVMVEGSLSSVTDAQFIANDQVAIIGNPLTQKWEYVAFRDAIQNVTGDFSVSTLIRGLRGTDSPEVTEIHAEGDLFIVADRTTIDRIMLVLGDLNVTRFYRGVGRNDFLENAATVPLASKGQALMPHRPHQLTAVVDGSGNIDFGWARSARLYYELTNAASWNTSSLEEDTEAYSVDIYDVAGGSVVRTLADVTSEVAEYTKADLITDLAVSNGTAQIDVGSTSTFTQATGSFVTDGFLVGMKIETALFTDGANNGIFTVKTVAALTLTVEETTLVAETGTGDETVTAIREDDITFEVFQKSVQVGRGFGTGQTTVKF